MVALQSSDALEHEHCFGLGMDALVIGSLEQERYYGLGASMPCHRRIFHSVWSSGSGAEENILYKCFGFGLRNGRKPWVCFGEMRLRFGFKLKFGLFKNSDSGSGAEENSQQVFGGSGSGSVSGSSSDSAWKNLARGGGLGSRPGGQSGWGWGWSSGWGSGSGSGSGSGWAHPSARC